MANDKFAWNEGDVQLSACAYCIHKHPGTASCTAFPDGIPDDILLMRDDHLDNYPGDNGLQFEARPNTIIPERLRV